MPQTFMTDLLNLDKTLFLFLNALFSNPFFDILFPLITEFNFWIVPGVIAIGFFYRKEKRKALIILGLAILLAAITDPLCSRVLKPFFHRLRPCHPLMIIENVNYLLGKKTSYSFPSAHAMNIFAQAALFSGFYPRKRLYFVGFALLIAFSRIYVGVHYPLDVIIGAIIGAGIGWLLHLLGKRAVEWRRSPQDLSTSPLPGPVSPSSSGSTP